MTRAYGACENDSSLQQAESLKFDHHAHGPKAGVTGRRLLLDRGWLFHLGDIESPVPNTHIAAYMNNKAGWSRGAARTNFDDSDWRILDLPHDWAIEGKFDPNNHVDAGFLPRGIAWYRRHFRVEESDRGQYLALQFDGVATHCTVYVNGHLMHRNFCGYTPFTIDISDVANFGDELNVIAVRVDATYLQGWWYEGAGIYRHTWLIKTSPVHVATDGIFVRPERDNQGNWETWIQTTLQGTGALSGEFGVKWDLIDPLGNVVAWKRQVIGTPSRFTRMLVERIPIKHPALWSLAEPNLYRLVTTIWRNGVVIDEYSVRFGYRTIRFDAREGFFLNDQPVKLKGTCNHQDHAGLGVALPDSIHRFRIQRLLEMGSNAYRCAHHPPAPELLDACDELGMLVMDENRNFGTSPEHVGQLSAMVRRDRNHPSVILWSICNEEAIQGTPVAARIARTMCDVVKSLDPSRPVTAAVSGGLMNEDFLGSALDVVGINYLLHQHDAFHDKHPDTPIVAAETHCVVSTRDTEKTDPARFIFASDDSEVLPWGKSARETWQHVSSRPWLAGLFAWTGFDYRGEPSPHGWPCVNSQFGMMDTCGFPKEAYVLHQALFSGRPFVRPKLGSNDSPVALGLEIHPTVAATATPADGEYALPVTVFAIDGTGQRVTTASNDVTFELAGPGRILGVGNGDPTSHESDKASSRSLFHGLAQLIIQTTDVAGEIQITATSPALKPATLHITTVADALRPAIPPATVRHFIRDWRMSPIRSSRAQLDTAVRDHDMNSWDRIDPSQGPQLTWINTTGFAIYRATFTPPKSLQPTGGRIVFHHIIGAVEVSLNDAIVLQTPLGNHSEIEVPFAPTGQKISVSVVIASGGPLAGIAANVELLAP